MSQRLVYFNGDFIPEHEARISIFDSALQFGDMVFEVTRTFNQKPFRLREHLEAALWVDTLCGNRLRSYYRRNGNRYLREPLRGTYPLSMTWTSRLCTM